MFDSVLFTPVDIAIFSWLATAAKFSIIDQFLEEAIVKIFWLFRKKNFFN